MNTRLRQLSQIQVDSLGRYALLATSAQRAEAHALSPDAERYRGAVIESALISFSDAYDRIENRLPAPRR